MVNGLLIILYALSHNSLCKKYGIVPKKEPISSRFIKNNQLGPQPFTNIITLLCFYIKTFAYLYRIKTKQQ